MTKMFDYDGIIIYVYPRDHNPIHCHVSVDGSELKIFLPEYAIELKNGKMPNASTLKKVLEIVKENKTMIGKEWRRFHGN